MFVKGIGKERKMMEHNIFNSRNQIVGYIENSIYNTNRNKSKGEIFVFKQTFGDKFFEVPVAIDKSILERLIKQNVKKTRMLIINLEKSSFVVEFDNETFLKEGAEINYDKRNAYGQNYTSFGSQIVYDLRKGNRIYSEKEKLEKYL